MKKTLLTITLLFSSAFTIFAQSGDEKQILQVLNEQLTEWNKGDLDSFMKGYWDNDSLMFIGKSGVTYGYKNTLNHYKEAYNNADKMGKLSFDILKVKKLSGEYFFVVGKWFLKRNAGDASGHYTLLFHKINNRWVIVADHSS